MDKEKEDCIGKRSREGIYWNVTLKLLHQSYHIAVFVVLARILTLEEFGVAALALPMIAFTNQWTSCGLTNVIVHRKQLSDEEVNTIFTLNLSLSLTMVIIMAGLASVMASTFDVAELTSMLPVLAVIFPLTSYHHTRLALLRRNLSFRLHSVIDLVFGMILSTVTLGLALLGFGAWSFVWGHITGTATAMLAIAILAPWRPRLCWRFGKLRAMMRFAGFDVLRSQMTYLEQYLSYWIVGYWMTPAVLGLYDRASAISRMPLNRINLQINAVFFPAFCRLRTDSVRLERAFRRSLTAQGMVMSPVLVGLAAVSPHAIPLILGSKWESTIIPLQILCAAVLVRIFATTLQSMNVATHVYARQAVAQLVSLFAYAALCVLSLRWGIIGVSWATLAYSLVTFVLYAMITLKVLDRGVTLLVDCLAPPLTGALIMGLFLLVLSKTTLGNITVINLLSLIAVGAAVYAGWMLWIPHEGVRSVREDILADLKRVLKKFRFNISESSD